ncbi:alanine--tRNA ligase [Gloeobacter morelensis]|uniref:Alanine--tRNA ligase n=1 Tax=Gloeobacter morelensis MG652769 TaxID=2781736 RepID=A0ABY3PLE0_9CYAN|nr:alanine--tRNA ligase [Gloeobacter morelensis]UFP94476.1 alanine--tRNA ligase [Gloeobacter morelensis MG652769]
MPTVLSGNAIREKFLQFFESKQHRRLPSASLVPDDPTVLLTIAGMLPFKPVFMGKRERPAPRVTTSQKCVRTNDIENVGRTARHHTFFEMLGNFSFGDYFKREAIGWAWELVTGVFELPPERLWVSVYEEDEEAFDLWQEVAGLPPVRVRMMGADSNFWESGPTGPCGPCSEIYYDFHPERGEGEIDLDDDSRFLEIYNLVFMQLNRDSEGTFSELPRKNIDTGLGLERMAQVLQGVPNNYETDLVFPIIRKAEALSGLDYFKAGDEQKISFKIIGDHTRAAVHLVADGVLPGNLGRGYILRRLIRRMVRHGRMLGIAGSFLPQMATVAVELMGGAYPNLLESREVILTRLASEESQFLQTLETGERLLDEILGRSEKRISGVDAFMLYDTYGFPLELTMEVAAERGLEVDVPAYEEAMEKQRERARRAAKTVDLTQGASLADLERTDFLGYRNVASEAVVKLVLFEGEPIERASAGASVQLVLDRTPFYPEGGGQIGDRGYLSGPDLLVRIEDVQKRDTVILHTGRIERGTVATGVSVQAQIDLADRRRSQAHHTATHLLQAALKKVLGESVQQQGSLVAFDRLRFDFSWPKALSQAEIQQVEDLVNTWIAEAHTLSQEVMPIDQAKARGALAFFGEKYGSEVRVIDVPGVSIELCGGTHVRNTAEIGLFKMVSETGIASGVRRIEAVAGPAVLEYLRLRDTVTRQLADEFKVQVEQIPQRVAALTSDLKQAQKQIDALKAALATARAEALLGQAKATGSLRVLVADLGDTEPEALKSAAEHLLAKLGEGGAVVLGSAPAADKVSLVAAFGKNAIAKGLNAGKFVGEVAKITGGGGGGRPNLAQAGGKQPEKLKDALDEASSKLSGALGA